MANPRSIWRFGGLLLQEEFPGKGGERLTHSRIYIKMAVPNEKKREP